MCVPLFRGQAVRSGSEGFHIAHVKGNTNTCMAIPVIVRTVSGINAPIYGGYLLIFLFSYGEISPTQTAGMTDAAN